MLHFTDRPMARVCSVVTGLLQNVQSVKGVSEDCYVLTYVHLDLTHADVCAPTNHL